MRSGPGCSCCGTGCWLALPVIIVALWLGVTVGSAQARSLTIHRAAVAARAYGLREFPELGEQAVFCERRTRVRVACGIDGFVKPGDPGGPNLEIPGSKDATGQECWIDVIVRLTRRGLHVSQP